MFMMTVILIQTFIHLFISQIKYCTSMTLKRSFITANIQISTHGVVLQVSDKIHKNAFVNIYVYIYTYIYIYIYIYISTYKRLIALSGCPVVLLSEAMTSNGLAGQLIWQKLVMS